MSRASASPRRILTSIDFSDQTPTVLAAGVALTRERQASLHLAVVGQPRAGDKVSIDFGDKVAELPKRAALGDFRMRVAAELKALEAEDLEPDLHVLAGSAGEQIVALAAELDADLIVVGTHGRRGPGRVLLGSVAEWIVRHAGCPVLVARDKNHRAALAALGRGESEGAYGIML